MAYIIENANLLRKDHLERVSLLVKQERFESLRPSFRRFSYLRFDAHSYIMTPPHILYIPKLPLNLPFQEMKSYFIKELIRKGCTMFLTYAEVNKEYLLVPAIKSMKKNLLNSPVDFAIGVKIPVHLLTPSFIRKCKKEKIPAIFVEMNEASQLNHIPWGWVREALFPYNCPFIPVFTSEKPRARKRAEVKWANTLSHEKLPFVEHELKENEPVPHKELCKTGIYPVKSGIQQGGEVSYNFYQKEEGRPVSEEDLFRMQDEHLVVTVHKGTVVRAGNEVLYRPGFGEYVTINTPSFFRVE